MVAEKVGEMVEMKVALMVAEKADRKVVSKVASLVGCWAGLMVDFSVGCLVDLWVEEMVDLLGPWQAARMAAMMANGTGGRMEFAMALLWVVTKAHVKVEAMVGCSADPWVAALVALTVG